MDKANICVAGGMECVYAGSQGLIAAFSVVWGNAMKKILFILIFSTLAITATGYGYGDERSWGTDAMLTTQIVDRAVNGRVVSEFFRQQGAKKDGYPVNVWVSQSFEQVTAKESGGWKGFRESQNVSLAGVDVHLPKLLAGISLGRIITEGSGSGFGTYSIRTDGTIVSPYLGLQFGDNVLLHFFYAHWELDEDLRNDGITQRHVQRDDNAAGVTAHYLLRFDNLLLDTHAGTQFAGSGARHDEVGQLAQWRTGLDARYTWNSLTFLLGADYVGDYREYVGYNHAANGVHVYDKNEVAVRAGLDYALSDGFGLKFEGNKSFFREKYTQYGADLQLKYRF